MVAYYTNNQLDKAWVDEKAREAASSFCSDSRNTIKSAQLRKFYAEVKTQERRWIAGGGDEASFAAILPMIKLLKAKSEYALARKVVPASFRDWLCGHVDSINSDKDFKAFLLHFEAVVGFSYQWIKD